MKDIPDMRKVRPELRRLIAHWLDHPTDIGLIPPGYAFTAKHREEILEDTDLLSLVRQIHVECLIREGTLDPR